MIPLAREGDNIPTLAARFILRTLMHSATAAPELSMTLSMDWVEVSVYCGGEEERNGQGYIPLVESWWRLGCGWRRLLSLVS
jgi:hypothetical protein